MSSTAVVVSSRYIKDAEELFSSVCQCKQNSAFAQIPPISNWIEMRNRYINKANEFKKTNELQALHYFHHAMLCDMRNISIYEKIVDILINHNKFRAAMYYCNMLQKISANDAFLLAAKVYFAQNKYTESRTSLERPLLYNPTNEDALFLLGLRSLLMKQHNECQVYLEKYLNIKINDFNAKFCLASRQLLVKNYEEAIKRFEELVDIKNDYFLTYYHIALAHFMKCEYREAVKNCEATLDLQFFPQAYQLKTHALFEHLRESNLKNEPVDNELKQTNEIIFDLYTEIKLDAAFYIKNILLMSIKKIEFLDYGAAIEDYNKCVSIIRETRCQKLYNLLEKIIYHKCVVTYLENCNENDALTCLNDLPYKQGNIELYKISNFVYFIGYLHLKLGNDTMGSKFLSRAIDLNDRNIYYYSAKVLTLIRREKYNKAISLIKKGMEKVEKTGLLRYYYAYCLVCQNSYSKAAEELSLLLPKYFDNEKMIEDFCSTDLYNESLSTKWYYEIDQSKPFYVIEKYLVQRDAFKLDMESINIESEIEYNIYFEFKNANYLLFKSLINFENKEFDNAKTLLEEAYKLDQSNFGIHCLKSLVHFHLNEIEKAEYHITFLFNSQCSNKFYLDHYRDMAADYVLKHKTSNLSNLCLAFIKIHINEYEIAEKLLIDVLNSNKKIEEFEACYIYELIMKFMHKSRKMKELEKYINQANQRFNLNSESADEASYSSNLKRLISELNFYSGIVFYHKGDYKSARYYLDKVLSAPGCYMLAKIYSALTLKKEETDMQTALTQLEHFFYLTVDDSPKPNRHIDTIEMSKFELKYHIAECYYRLGKYDKCIEYLSTDIDEICSERVKLEYQADDALCYYGLALMQKKLYEDALIQFDKMNVENKEKKVFILYCKGKCYFKLNDKKRAGDCFAEIPCEIESYRSGSIYAECINQYDFILYTLQSIYYIICEHFKSNQHLKLNFYLTKFDNLLKLFFSDEKICSDKTLLLNIYCYLVLVEYHIKANYEETLKQATEAYEKFQNFSNFLYYAGLSSFKIATNETQEDKLAKPGDYSDKEDEESENEESRNVDDSSSNKKPTRVALLKASENYFKNFIESQKNIPKSTKTAKMRNSEYYLGRIHQENGNFYNSLEHFGKIMKAKFIKNSTIEDCFDNNEYNRNGLKFSYALSLFKIGETERSKDEFIELLVELEKHLKKTGQLFETNQIYTGTKYYLGIIGYNETYKKTESALSFDDSIKLNFRAAMKNEIYKTDSRYYLGQCYLFEHKFAEALEEFKLIKDPNYKHAAKINEYMMEILFEVGKMDLEEKFSLEGKDKLKQALSIAVDIIETAKKTSNDELLLKAQKLSVISYYYLEEYFRLHEYINEHKLLQRNGKTPEFYYFYAISMIKTRKLSPQSQDLDESQFTEDPNKDEYLKIKQAYKFFAEYISIMNRNKKHFYKKKQKHPEESTETIDNNKTCPFDLTQKQQYLASKYYIGYILTDKLVRRYDESIKVFVEMVSYNPEDPVEKTCDTATKASLKKFMDEQIDKMGTPDFQEKFANNREFELRDVYYHLAISLFNVKPNDNPNICNEQSFKLFEYVLKNYKIDDIQRNKILFYLGRIKFRLKEYSKSKEYFDILINNTNFVDNKHRLSKYYIGIALYNYNPPNFELALKEFRKFKGANSIDLSNKSVIEVFIKLSQYLISSSYELAIDYYGQKNFGKWQEYFSWTISFCNEVLGGLEAPLKKLKSNTAKNNECKKFENIYLDVSQKLYFSYFLLEKYDFICESLAKIAKEYPRYAIFMYLLTLCTYKLSSLANENEQRIEYGKQSIVNAEKFLNLYSNGFLDKCSIKQLLNVKYIKANMLLSQESDEEYEDAVVILKDIDESYKALQMEKEQNEEKKHKINEDIFIQLFEGFDLKLKIGVTYFKLEQYELASSYVDELLEKLEKNKDDPRFSDLSYYAGVIHIKSEMRKEGAKDKRVLDKIEQNLKHVRFQSTYYVESRLYLGQLYYLKCLYDDSLKQFNKIQNEIEKHNLKINNNPNILHDLKAWVIKVAFSAAMDHFKANRHGESEEMFIYTSEKCDELVASLITLNKLSANLKNHLFTAYTNSSWSLFYLHEYEKLNKLLDEIKSRHDIESISKMFEDFNYLKGVCCKIMHEETNDENKRQEAKDIFYEYLFGKDICGIDDESTMEKHITSKYFLSNIYLQLRQYSETVSMLVEVLAFILSASRKVKTIEALMELFDNYDPKIKHKQYRLLSISSIIYDFVEAISEYDIMQKNYQEVLDVLGKLKKVDSKLKLIDNKIEERIRFQEARVSILIYLKDFKEVTNEDEAEQQLRETNAQILSYIEVLKNVPTSSKNHPDAMVLLANYYYKHSAYEEAKFYIHKMEEGNHDVNYTDIDDLLLNIYSKKLTSKLAYNLEEILKDFENLFERNRQGKLKQKFMLASVKLKLKFQSNDKNALSKAFELAKQAYDQFPLIIEFLYLEAQCAFYLEYDDVCIEYVNEYLEKGANNIPKVTIINSHYYKAEIYKRSANKKHLEKLIKELECIRSFNENTDLVDLNEVISCLAESYFKFKDFDNSKARLLDIEEYYAKRDVKRYANLKYMIGYCYLQENNLIETLKYFKLVVEIDDSHEKFEDIYFYICSLHYRFGDLQECYRVCLDYERKINDKLTTNSEICVYKLASKFWMSINDKEELEKLVMEINNIKMNQQNNNPFIEFYQGIALYELEEFDKYKVNLDFVSKTLNDYLDSIIDTPLKKPFRYLNTVDVHFINGFLLFYKKEYERCLHSFNKFLSSLKDVNEKNPNYSTLTTCYKAISCYFLAQEKKSYSDDLTDLSKEIMNDLTKSFEYFQKISNSTSYNRNHICLYLANIHYDFKDYHNSLIEFNKYVQLNGDGCKNDEIVLKMSICLYELDKLNESLRLLLEIKIQTIETCYQKGLVASMQANYVDAIKYFNEAAAYLVQENFANKANKRFHDVYLQKGVIYYKQKKYKEAIEQFDKQISVCNSYPDAYAYKILCFDDPTFKAPKPQKRDLLEMYDRSLLSTIKNKWFENRTRIYGELIRLKPLQQVFISYSWENKDKVKPVCDLLEKFGFTCYMDQHESSNKESLSDGEKRRIENCQAFLSFISPSYIKRVNCKLEVDYALSKNKILYPIIIEKVATKDHPWPVCLQEMDKAFDSIQYTNLTAIDQQDFEENLVNYPVTSEILIRLTKYMLD